MYREIDSVVFPTALFPRASITSDPTDLPTAITIWQPLLRTLSIMLGTTTIWWLVRLRLGLEQTYCPLFRLIETETAAARLLMMVLTSTEEAPPPRSLLQGLLPLFTDRQSMFVVS